MVAAYGQATGQTGKRYWVEKTPGNERHLQVLESWYPGLRAVYIVRDPRDVFTSHARRRALEPGGHRELSVEGFVRHWGISVAAWQHFAARHEGCALVRYEDLVRYPRATVASLCSVLEIEYEDVLQSPTRNGKLWRGNSMHGDTFTGVSARPIGRWRERLAPEALLTIETYLGRAMAAFGYPRATEPPSLAQAAAHWCRAGGRKGLLGTLMRLYYPFRLPRGLRKWSEGGGGRGTGDRGRDVP